MPKCKCGNEYHADHGCGVAVGSGSSYADHCMRCEVSNLFTPSYVNNDSGVFPSLEKVVSRNYKYAPWESPAGVGMCPWCWHKENTIKTSDRSEE